MSPTYDSLLYPKQAGNTGNILPDFKDTSLGTHSSQFQSKLVGGTVRKRFTNKKGTIIRRKIRRVSKTCRRKSSSRRRK